MSEQSEKVEASPGDVMSQNFSWREFQAWAVSDTAEISSIEGRFLNLWVRSFVRVSKTKN